MKLNIQSIHFDADTKLIDFIQKKLDKLDTFSDRIIDGEVFLRLHKDSESKDNKMLEVKINLPGTTIFAKETSSTFEAAADIALEALKSQVKKYKDKKQEKPSVLSPELAVVEDDE
jgi:putative sigma-54 modulation protein